MNTNQIQFYTYLHCRSDGSPFYVGKGKDTSKGRRSHIFNTRSKHHKSIVAKYGRENIGIYVFPCESEEQAFKDEIQQIAQLRQDGYELCNYTDGGEGTSGYKRGPHSMETKKKISEAKKGKILSAAHRAKIVAKLIGRPGVIHTAETRARISRTKIGKKLGPQSVEHREKIGLANSKHSPSSEVRARISATLKERARKQKEKKDG